MPKKTAKKKTLKSKKRTANKKVKGDSAKKGKKVRRRKKVIYPVNYHLHTKKLEIMRAIPIMPCTIIAKTYQGFLFAHTQAEKVYAVYRRECESRGLVTRRIKGVSLDAKHPELERTENNWKIISKPCVRYNGVWEISDTESGESETFCGSGDGDNNIWSIMSAQTVAKKAALLDYFETSWPAPTDWVRVVKESIEELGPGQMFKAIKEIIPAKIFEATRIGDELGDYFNKILQKSRE